MIQQSDSVRGTQYEVQIPSKYGLTRIQTTELHGLTRSFERLLKKGGREVNNSENDFRRACNA
jgi:hypothetical protein